MLLKPDFIFFEEIDSTSTYLRKNFDKHSSGTVASADFQTAGRGRGTNKWECKPGDGAMFSILTDRNPDHSIELVSHMALEVAEVIVGWLSSNHGIRASIKLPNDILYEGKKLCGILVEEVNDRMVIGVGVNLNSSPSGLQKNYVATSLSEIIPGSRYDNREVVKELATRILEGLS